MCCQIETLAVLEMPLFYAVIKRLKSDNKTPVLCSSSGDKDFLFFIEKLCFATTKK